ncbi:MAG: M56 family metallopeptidase [Planctomycetaceae bacterium]
MSPSSAAAVLLAGLTLPLALTAGVCSPWPCWMQETDPPAPVVVTPEAHAEFVAAPQPMGPMPDIEYSSVPADNFEMIENLAVVPATPAAPGEITLEPSATVAQPDWRRMGFALIAAVLLAGAVRLIAGWLAIRRLLAGSRSVEPFEALQLLADLRQALAVAATVELRESDALTTAATVGWRRPAILLPRGWQHWTNGELRAVLAHELAHVARGHYSAWILAQVGLSLHFYHPLLHWLAARLRLEQEYEADALAAEVSGGATTYLRTLAHLALNQPETPVSWPARAFLARPGTVVRRIIRLQQSRVTRPARSLPKAALLVVMLCTGLVAAGFRQPTPTTDNSSDATAIATDTKPDSKSAPTAEKELPTLEELRQAVAARERAYLPFHIKAMQTFVISDGLTAAERSKLPWADGRKHQKLMEYAQREPGTWYSQETMLTDGVVDMEYAWHVSGGREVHVSHRAGETGAGDIYLPDPSRPPRPYVWVQPLLGVFPLVGTSEPRLLSEALQQRETETHLDADGENAKLTIVTGPQKFQSRVVLWFSRAHDWHPLRAQFFLRRNVEELLYEWEARKLERQNGEWRVLAGAMQFFERESKSVPAKQTYALDFEIQALKYGDAVSAAVFSYEIPAGASVRNERDSPVEPAPLLTRDVAVTVVDVHGSPVPGATVTSKSRGFERLARELVNFSTDQSGRATVRAPDGDFGLLVHKDGSRDANWILGADDREMQVILAPITAGMVVDEHATPLKDVWVTSDHHSMPQFRFDGVINDPRNNVGFDQRSGWSDETGRFSLTSELTVRRTSDSVLISAMDLDQSTWRRFTFRRPNWASR